MNRLTDWRIVGLAMAAGMLYCGQAMAAGSSMPDKLSIGGGLVTEYQYKGYDYTSQPPGGSYKLDYFEVNVKGNHGPVSYAAEERFSATNFSPDHQYLHYGWMAYNFGQSQNQQVKVGYFQVPFGLLTYGYQSFWGSLGYYMGLNDNQAAGIGYKYESGNSWRFDADFFKNNTLGQNTMYGVNPVNDYHNINTGNLRGAYTLHQGPASKITFALSGKLGQVMLGGSPTNQNLGKHWATAASMNGTWGSWLVQLQASAYAYQIPNNLGYDPHAITVEDYGYQYNIPSKGQLYSANAAKSFHVNWGPFHKIQIYDNYAYLNIGTPSKTFQNYGGTVKNNMQLNTTGVEAVAGPVYIWADMMEGKNTEGASFVGPAQNGHWYSRFNLALAYYFATSS